MSPPRVSVVTIFLNAEAFLSEAIESVLAQDYTDFELIMVDDGSSDGSTGIAREYAAQHPDRCHYLEHPGHANLGMSASRNAGIAVARGEYITFIDADDVWNTPRKLSEQVAILDAHPQIGMVAGAACYWRSWQGGTDDIVPAGHLLDHPVPPRSASTQVYPLGKAQAPCLSIMVRRHIVEQVGGFEVSFSGMYEDQAFLSKIYLETNVWFSSSCWLLYRQHSKSCVAESIREGAYHHIRQRFLDWYEAYLLQQKVTDLVIWRALRKAQFRYRHPLLFVARSMVGRFIRRINSISTFDLKVKRGNLD